MTAKIVIIGDGAVGKTSLLWRWAKKEFKPEHTPTVFENYSTTVPVSGVTGERQQKLTLWDTGGQESFDKLRQLSYPGTHVFIVCFNLEDRISFENVSSVWLPEILPYLTGSAQALAASNSNGDGPSQPARMILVGTKLDLREGKPEAQRDMCVSTEEGEQLAHSIKADMYIECSAKAETNVKRVFDEAVKAFLKPPPSAPPQNPKKRCAIL
eukprot:Rhum_TRINITY_DN10736_c0_g1::Rhum_TRINITY_DN10736_c0_g1_i1::g.39738::m.39738/K04392/RAC1; Ras-related C3 botulinum toxin substrate 1